MCRTAKTKVKLNIYIYWSTYIYIYTFEFVCIYLCMYACISIHTYILEQGRWLGWYWWPPASQPSPMISYETARCASPGLLGAHCSLALPRVTLQMPGLWARPRFPRSQEKKDYDIWSHMVSECWYQSTDLSTRSIDHSWYWRLIRIHLPENTVDIDGR